MIQKCTAFRMVQSAWLLALLVLAYAYSGSLISKLTAPKNRFLINSLEDAAANEDVMPLVVKDSSSQEEFLVSILYTLLWHKFVRLCVLFFSCHQYPVSRK